MKAADSEAGFGLLLMTELIDTLAGKRRSQSQTCLADDLQNPFDP